jgi:hypothetical protein
MTWTMSEKTTMQLLLEARFQQLAQDQVENHEMPSELRQEVFDTLDVIHANGEATNLSVEKTEEATSEFIDMIESPDDENPPSTDS